METSRTQCSNTEVFEAEVNEKAEVHQSQRDPIDQGLLLNLEGGGKCSHINCLSLPRASDLKDLAHALRLVHEVGIIVAFSQIRKV